MTPTQFRSALSQLGLSHREAAAFLGYQERHIRRLVAGKCPVPPYIAKLLAIMIARKLAPRRVDAICAALFATQARTRHQSDTASASAP